MKNIYLFFIALFLFGCGSNPIFKSNNDIIACPPILFAKEHGVYIDSEYKKISTDNISYKAEINNAIFIDECFVDENTISAELSILFVAKPMNINQNIIKLPIYLAVIDEDENLTDIQYYFFNSNFQINSETGILIESDIVKNLKLNFLLKEESFKIIVGFMLDQERLDVLN